MAGWVTRMSHGAVPARDEAPACQSFELSAQSRLQAGATLAPWFRCGWLVRRSLRLFGPARRCFPDPFPLATFVSTSQTRLLATGNSPIRSLADGAFDTAFG